MAELPASRKRRPFSRFFPGVLIIAAFLAFPFPSSPPAAAVPPGELTPEEREYLRRLGPVKMCVDPDWYPYERLGENGEFYGIAADLIRLVAERSGVELELVPTSSWAESIGVFPDGTMPTSSPSSTRTRARDNGFSSLRPTTRNRGVHHKAGTRIHTGPRKAHRRTIVLARGDQYGGEGTKGLTQPACHHRQERDEVFSFVAGRKADMTLRPLSSAAYAIKKQVSSA